MFCRTSTRLVTLPVPISSGHLPIIKTDSRTSLLSERYRACVTVDEYPVRHAGEASCCLSSPSWWFSDVTSCPCHRSAQSLSPSGGCLVSGTNTNLANTHRLAELIRFSYKYKNTCIRKEATQHGKVEVICFISIELVPRAGTRYKLVYYQRSASRCLNSL